METIADALGQPVSVHLNLTSKKWVIATKPKGKILGYAESVTLKDVTFKVSEAQRQYCIRNNGRWVHAWALGTLIETDTLTDEGRENLHGRVDTSRLLRVTYNPFQAPTFRVIDGDDAWPVTSAPLVSFQDRYGWVHA